jgi:hypothetical protein
MLNADFASLPRNERGDILNLSDVFLDLTDAQIDRLSDDDWTRVQEYQEEIEIMKADFLEHEMPLYDRPTLDTSNPTN